MKLNLRNPDASIALKIGTPPVFAARTVASLFSRLVAQFHPDRILLFGSRARGNVASDCFHAQQAAEKRLLAP
jgi:hypothetical protein